MRRPGRWAALAVWLAAGMATAQTAHPPVGGASAPLPSGDGTVRGRIVGESGIPEGLDVILYALPEGGSPGLARTRADAEGRFQFDGVSTAPDTVYLVGVRVGEIPFGTRASFAAGQRELEVELELAETVADTSGVETGDVFLRIDRGCETVRVTQAVPLRNPTQSVVVVPEAQRGESEPVLRAELPEGAIGFSTPLGAMPPGLELDGREVRFWGPVYPGSQELEYGYALPAPDATLRFELSPPNRATRVVVLSDAAGPSVRGPALERAAEEDREIDGRAYRAVAAGALAPGSTLALELELPPATAGVLSARSSQLWLELDDAALVANEELVVSVPGDEPLSADNDAPLLCLKLPAGAEDLRFAPATLSLGIEPDASGALAVRGPLPAGETSLAWRYRLPSQGDELVFARSFPLELPLLSIFVADTGIVPVTTRMHRRRPVRNGDRLYLQLEAFAVAAGETVEIEFTRLASPGAPSALATLGIAALAAAAAVAFLAAPLRGRQGPAAETETETETERLAAERASVVDAIRDLDHDFETGKLTEDDHTALRGDLRARAVELLRAERTAATTGSAEPAADAAAGCARCGAEPPPGARFCPQCGASRDAGTQAG